MFSARDAAEHQVGPALRRDPLQRPRDGRVRRRVGRLGQHPRPDQHAAAARRDSVQRVHVPGGVRRGVAAGLAGARHAGAEDDRRAAGRATASWRPRGEELEEWASTSATSRKAFGSFTAREGRELLASPRASSSRCSALGLRQDDAAAHHRRARDRRLAARCCSRARTRPTPARAIAASASSSSTTRCSAT